MTHPVRDEIATATQRLAAVGVANPRVDADLLAAHVLGIDRGRLVAADPMTAPQRSRFVALVDRRLAREPLQHIIGSAPFGPVTVAVGPGVFTPRPETELILAWAAGRRSTMRARPRVVDLCSGSGALAIGVATVTDATVVAVERDDDAARWLRRNVEASPATVRDRIEVVRGDATTLDWVTDETADIDLVVANPPYVPTSTPVPTEVADFDPAVAVFAGPDGMSVIDPMVAVIAALLRPDGLCAVEHDDSTADRVIAAFAATGAFDDIRGHRDLADRPRFVTARRRSPHPARMGR
ncbi:N5-glutamine methyltransferase family protein [Williamsia deligens]|uniref:Release factor glutamine methyltransferase n=1 Tax=Williamsia deligens TaxID=321325 RepID=A0ABW3GBC8_9NOCA|nr:HemK/PrmC family methyltransferase [Williamsia deligens]MCP2196266.1 release factor glutamine methyltransferase [Williamsia deligens]